MLSLGTISDVFDVEAYQKSAVERLFGDRWDTFGGTHMHTKEDKIFYQHNKKENKNIYNLINNLITATTIPTQWNVW